MGICGRPMNWLLTMHTRVRSVTNVNRPPGGCAARVVACAVAGGDAAALAAGRVSTAVWVDAEGSFSHATARLAIAAATTVFHFIIILPFAQ